ncbi:helix-turn-helix transcriptional regulator [Mesorhizobium sp. CAU 1741]|uniref:helix-turn-helix transcriptional regulator n=1 Tax=Mesorhizobium sp. CAU 1741 TaxID=3140366 RepID=UPI00325C331F
MIHLASTTQPIEATAPVASRAGLARLMRRLCADIGAERYMIVQPSFDRGPKSMRIITSNWIFDALEDFGSDGIGKIIESGNASGPGAVPRPLLPATALFLSEEERCAMREHGHAELYCQKLNADGVAIFALFSAETPRRIDAAALMRAHMKCSYAIVQFFRSCGGQEASNPLSDRERECLLWVSEGKTTDEVALILGVSPNTVSSYIAHAIQKFSANNRAMAIATAIRSGII